MILHIRTNEKSMVINSLSIRRFSASFHGFLLSGTMWWNFGYMLRGLSRSRGWVRVVFIYSRPRASNKDILTNKSRVFFNYVTSAHRRSFYPLEIDNENLLAYSVWWWQKYKIKARYPSSRWLVVYGPTRDYLSLHNQHAWRPPGQMFRNKYHLISSLSYQSVNTAVFEA